MLDRLISHYRSKKGVADIYGLILYDRRHPNILKTLRDEDYWKSFDEISGDKWVIFSTRAKPIQSRTPSGPSSGLYFMTTLPQEPEENKLLFDYFDIDSLDDLPVFIVFTHYENQLLQQVIKLDDSSKENAFSSIKTAIELITVAVDNMDPLNFKSSAGVYAAVSLKVENYLYWRRIRKVISFYKWVKDHSP